MTVTEALELARLQGVEVTLDGDDLVLKAEAAPPPGLLAILAAAEWDIVAALRLREAEERSPHRAVDDHFHPRHLASAPIAATGRDRGPVRPSVRRKRSGRVHACHSFSHIERSSGGPQCARLGIRPTAGIALPSTQRPVHNDAPPHEI